MTRAPVVSSNIVSVGYADGTLEVEFLNGAIYVYRGVPPDLHAGLMAADSLGAYFSKYVRPWFVGVKVTAGDAA